MTQTTANNVNIGKLQPLLMQGARNANSYAPDDIMFYFEEYLTLDECRATEAFLNWIVDNDKHFGWNFPEVWAEWVQTLPKA